MYAYNGEKYLREQIDSILLQLNNNDELIISDDGSTDATINIINSYDDSRIRLFHHDKDASSKNNSFYFVKDNFENALKYSTGDYIFLSDQDDIWLPAKVEKSIQALKNNTNKGLLVSRSIRITEDKKILEYKRPLKKSYNFINVSMSGPFSCCTMCMTKDFLGLTMPFNKKVISHDTWLVLVALKYEKLFILNEELIMYRLHSYNVTGANANSLWFKIYYRLIFMIEYLKLPKINNNKTR